MSLSPRHAVLIPSYNSGSLLAETVKEALGAWPDVIVVIDGSDDGSDRVVAGLCAEHAGLAMLRLPTNRGKGAAVLAGALWARAHGFSHVLTMDADGQHPASAIHPFVSRSQAWPDAMVLGRPVFGKDAPFIRVWGREISNMLVGIETGGMVRDCLFGFRVYPLAPLIATMEASRFMRGFDFDPEVVARLCWHGVPAENIPTSVRYPSANEGGISHFHYGRDNLRLILMHLRLLFAWMRGGNRERR
ncbi:glycosyltransferase [Neoasaia chiangmaiensis NBRC 101099]|uniref:Uncharacterized protein n=1 Tax=Neoasaia chiangmaiensis TaxID=320497 RepID=A0A1U9KLS9_9PROT|nr:glycosyltransferase family 2 protein [Neoasaia chiangmaiensis]AQS86751.1 hypothetical protein A0U93_00925 [Neoasaia chiangmaiensis]GBR35571.1 glycosyltransferase [Neoasaia chiangmaiensis NBRC 101099]GEN16397.1 hypothetical protein NCH01_28280 [Neoasaia chiangmaiensis]